MPGDGHESDPSFAQGEIDRRKLLLLGLGAGVGLLAGCSTTATQRSAKMPGPIWPDAKLLEPPPAIVRVPQAKQLGPQMANVLPRSSWTRGTPNIADINPMLPVQWITVHHDGMTPFMATDYASSASRIELIRNGHRGKGWADIGYHFIIDRSGRVWEGRELCYQGAHVKNHNEGNLGILCVGNFDQQAPSAAQLAALERQLKVCMKEYKVASSCVRSHQEWPGASTACPGRNMQSKMQALRRSIA